MKTADVHVRRREVLQAVGQVGQPLRLEQVMEGAHLGLVVRAAGDLGRAVLRQLAVDGVP